MSTTKHTKETEADHYLVAARRDLDHAAEAFAVRDFASSLAWLRLAQRHLCAASAALEAQPTTRP